jgi:hypothetical protein
MGVVVVVLRVFVVCYMGVVVVVNACICWCVDVSVRVYV